MQAKPFFKVSDFQNLLAFVSLKPEEVVPQKV